MLVLDDLHELGAGAAMADLDRLLRHPPRALRIVAATRIDPPLRLGRMRLAGDLCDMRERDLAFTEAETAALLRAGGTELEPDAVRVLWQRTEGWAAGLRMAAIALRTHPDPAGSWPPSRATTSRWPTTCSPRCSPSSRPSSSTSSCGRRSSASSRASSRPS